MIIIDKQLARREAENRPIQVGMIGAGEMGIGLVNQIERHVPGMRVAAIFNRNPGRAKEAYKTAGHSQVKQISTAKALEDAVVQRQPAVTDSLEALLHAGGLDVLVEMTGAIEFAFDAILRAFAAGKHVVSFNAELDATIGPYLQLKASEAGVRYTLGDGDQPGVTMNLYRHVRSMGFRPLVCGNIKGMLDHYRNPDTQKGFAEKAGLSVKMVTSFADGTKVALEQATIANATGMRVARRGMIGIEADAHVDDLTDRYDLEELEALGGVVEMVVGARPGPGVFVYATTEDPISKRFLAYGKLGDGPLYSFYVPYHLLFFELPFSIARLVDFGDGTLDALDRFYVEVISTAKKDLKAGDRMDGMGGFHVYGECENRSVVKDEDLVPVGLIEGMELKTDVPKGRAIRWADVKYETGNALLKAYRSID